MGKKSIIDNLGSSKSIAWIGIFILLIWGIITKGKKGIKGIKGRIDNIDAIDMLVFYLFGIPFILGILMVVVINYIGSHSILKEGYGDIDDQKCHHNH